MKRDVNIMTTKERKPIVIRSLILIFSLIIICVSVFSQNKSIDFNEKYKFPFSIGLGYQVYSPLTQLGTDFGAEFQVIDLSLAFRIPIPLVPIIQPFLQAGMISIDSIDRIDLEKYEKFNHKHIYSVLGIGYANHLSKQFEIGVEATGGVSYAIFDKLVPGELRSSYNLLVGAGAKLTLNISYNISIDGQFGMKYIYSFSPLERFNGFIFGMGINGNYRFGEDPDAPKANVRSIKFVDAKVNPLFAAIQSFYVKNPIGKVNISNTEKYSITDIEVSFFQAGYMDTKTKALSIPKLKPKEAKEVELIASFNQNIFTTEGITPLTGEIVVDYIARGRAISQSHPVSYDLYDKESITWDDDKKVAAFITPADSALRNYASFVRKACKDLEVSGLNTSLQTAMQVYYALGEIGCLYQKDPTSPFEAAKGNPVIIDSVSLPRNTLKRGTGDCDDLTVLYCSLLETVGIETAFVTVPGHIYAGFNTEIPSKEYRIIHPDPSMTFNFDGELWVLIEVTMIGKKDFFSAWRKGSEEYSVLDSSPEKRAVFFTRKAQETYRPIMLKETDLGLQYGDKIKITRDFRRDVQKHVSAIIDEYENIARSKQNKGSYNELGVTCSKLGSYDRAKKAFNTALSMDRNYLSPKVNLGNVYFMEDEFQNALRIFHNAERVIEERGEKKSNTLAKVFLNISRCYYELENYDRAAEYAGKLDAIDPDLASKYSYLKGKDSSSRAADIDSTSEVRFVEEE